MPRRRSRDLVEIAVAGVVVVSAVAAEAEVAEHVLAQVGQRGRQGIGRGIAGTEVLAQRVELPQVVLDVEVGIRL